MGGLLIREDMLTKYSIIDRDTSEGQKIHKFLFDRAKRLAGHIIDFEKNPVTFVLSDSDEPNAFFILSPDQIEQRKRNNDHNVKNFINPYDTAVICFTKPYIEMFEYIDDLDCILGHELTHMFLSGFGIENNSKGEEEIADLHAVDLVYDAGSDPKRALEVRKKIHAYIEANKEKLAHEQREKRYSDDKESELNWSEIFDVHMTEANRIAAIEASLTRLSHLIDDRQPSEFDKSVFDVRYTDPVDSFLNANDYEQKTAQEKIKLLIDCVDHISKPMPEKAFLKGRIETLEKEFRSGCRDFGLRTEHEKLSKALEEGAEDYFSGKLIEKKYQQKIAELAEGIIKDIQYKRQKKLEITPADKIDKDTLRVYLLNAAQKHIEDHGYPQDEDINYTEAAGIMYSYFHTFLSKTDYGRPENYKKGQKPKIEKDISKARKAIRSATNFEDFKAAAERFSSLTNIHANIASTSHGPYGKKFDNLSFVNNWGSYHEKPKVFAKPKPGKPLPWAHLYDFAQASDEAKDYVVTFLNEQGIQDYRLSHNLPYVRYIRHNYNKITPKGMISKKKVPDYEVEYLLNKELIEHDYTIIQNYIDTEKTLFEETINAALNLEDEDFHTLTDKGDDYSRFTAAELKVYNLLFLHNSLPKPTEEEEGWSYSHAKENITTFIDRRYLADNPLKAIKKDKYTDDQYIVPRELFHFNNPIFIKRFGKKLNHKIMRQREQQRDQIFDGAMQVIQMCVNLWPDLNEAVRQLEEEKETIREKQYVNGHYTHSDAVEEELYQAEKRLAPLRKKKESIDNFLGNYLSGIFKRPYERYYALNRLTEEQKNIIADYVITDKDNVLFKYFKKATKFQKFADFRYVFPKQIKHMLNDNYTPIDELKVLAKTMGHKDHKNTVELKLAIQEHDNYGTSHYTWMLYLLQEMRSLNKSPATDVDSLVTCVMNMAPQDPRYANDDAELACSIYLSYRNLLREGNFLNIITKAIDYQPNYDGLNFNETFNTINSLTKLSKTIKDHVEIKESNSYLEEKVSYLPHHQENLDLIDKNIKNLIRKVHHLALQNPDTLQKISSLHLLYNTPEKNSSYREGNYGHALEAIIKEDKTLDKISLLSQDDIFWPEDPLDFLKAFVFAKHTFLDDIEQENHLLSLILDRVEQLPASKKKNECFFILLDKSMRAAYPETRERLFDLYTQDIISKLGQDDCSEGYQKKLSVYLKALEDDKNEKRKNRRERQWDVGARFSYHPFLSNTISAADRYIVLNKLAHGILSQEETSRMLKKASTVSLNSKDMFKSYLYGIGIDYITSEMDEDAETAKKFLQFFNSKGENKDCEDMSKLLISVVSKRSNNNLETILSKLQPVNCRVLYQNFWSAPIEARSVIISRILKSAVAEDETQESEKSWERIFEIVMDNLIPPTDTSVESQYAREIMHSYVKARSYYERELILSAMMVANRNIGKDAGNVGKALKLFFENMGPAEIKLGQAISSHPKTPEKIRKELQELKNEANTPARWTVYDWIRNENIPEKLWKNVYLGEILGSASYYLGAALGEDDVLKILVSEARERAKKGFHVTGKTIEDLKQKDKISDLDFQELTSSTIEMVRQADRMSHIETDHVLGEKQCDIAKTIYNNVQLKSGQYTFKLKVMDWKAKGQNWVVMKRAKGPIFNKLPEDTPEQIEYKKAFAMGYIFFELTQNILSGKKFDHDKHGAQLCVDPDTNSVGIFDTGAMALKDPTIKEQRLLGNVIYEAIKDSIKSETLLTQLGSVFSQKIQELYEQDIDTQYLIEVQKGILALGDFFKVLDQDDIRKLLSAIDIYNHLSEEIKLGVDEKMNVIEKAYLNSVLMTNNSQKQKAVSIIKDGKAQDDHQPVEAFTVQPNIPKKSKWLQEIFTRDDSDMTLPFTPEEFRQSHIHPLCLTA